MHTTEDPTTRPSFPKPQHSLRWRNTSSPRIRRVIGNGLGERHRRWEEWHTRPDPHAASSSPRPTTPPPPIPNSILTHLFPDRDPLRATVTVRYLLNAWHSTTSAPAEGDAFMEEDSHKRTAVAESSLYCNVLHRVLYPQVHGNGLKKKKKRCFLWMGVDFVFLAVCASLDVVLHILTELQPPVISCH